MYRRLKLSDNYAIIILFEDITSDLNIFNSFISGSFQRGISLLCTNIFRQGEHFETECVFSAKEFYCRYAAERTDYGKSL